MKLTLILTLLLPTALSLPTETPEVSVAVLPREIQKNHPTDLTITTYRLPGCTGKSETFRSVKYDASTHTYMQSFSLSRTLDPSEQLDFSTTGRYGEVEDTKCGVFVGKAGTGAVAGCHGMNTATCLRLWHH